MTAPTPDRTGTPDSRSTPGTAPGQAAPMEALAATWDAAAKRNRVHGQLAIERGDESGSEGFVYAQTFEHCAAELRATLAATAAAAPAPAAEGGHVTDMLGVAVDALTDIKGTCDAGTFCHDTAAGTLDIISKRLPGDARWELVPNGCPDAYTLRALLDLNHRLTWDTGLASERQRITAEREQAGMEALT